MFKKEERMMRDGAHFEEQLAHFENQIYNIFSGLDVEVRQALTKRLTDLKKSGATRFNLMCYTMSGLESGLEFANDMDNSFLAEEYWGDLLDILH